MMILALTNVWSAHTAEQGSAQDMPMLELNTPIKREIAGQQRHDYRIKLERGQYVRVEVDQGEVNVNMELLDPDGEQAVIAVRDPRGPRKEILETVAGKTGIHQLGVRSVEDDPGVRLYEVTLVEIRAATPKDEEIAKAEKKQRESFILRNNGRYDEAVGAVEEALALREKHFGREHIDTAESLNHLGNLSAEQGDFVKAETLLTTALAIRERVRSPEHSLVASSLSNLGVFFRDIGDYDRAEQRLRQSLAIKEETSDPNNRELAPTLNNLAEVYRAKRNFAEAERLYQRAIRIMEMAPRIGPNSSDVARVYSNLGKMYQEQGDYARAESALKHALAIYEKATDPNHPSRGISLNHLATVSFFKGDYAQAEELVLRALGIYQKSLGPGNPRVAEALNNLAAIYRATRRIAQAITTRKDSIAISEASLRRNLIAGSETQKLNFLALFAGETNDTLSLHAQYAPDDPQALHLAFTTWLQRKGRALDEMNRTIGLLRRYAGQEGQALFDQLAAKQTQLSRLVTSAPGEKDRAKHLASIKTLDEECERITAAISARSAQFRIQTQPVTLPDVQSVLPAGSALVEFARYSPIDARTKAKSDPRYLAYILPDKGAPRHVELGDAKTIDDAARELREAFSDRSKPDFRRSARKVDKLVMQPLRALLGSARQVFISPEGELNLIPFAALIGERNRYLIEDYLFIYLTSGRDLLRLREKHQSNPDVLIFAVPNFDGEAPVAQPGSTIGRSSDLRGTRLSASPSMAERKFDPLDFALAEGEAVKNVQPQARLIVGPQATESAVKQLSRPRILHIITHGFFLPDTGPNFVKFENPLLRSGLALAGANQRQSGQDDGILTA
ncbi:MAG: tetratricopeptide repeat protein, partial [Blastocatellia bacterium]